MKIDTETYTPERIFQFQKSFYHDDSLDEFLLDGDLEIMEDPLKRHSNLSSQREGYSMTNIGIQPTLNLGHIVALGGDYHAQRHPVVKNIAVVSYRKSEEGKVRTAHVKINDEQMQMFLERERFDDFDDFDFRHKVPMLKEI